MDSREKLLDQIDSIVNERTFSLEAVSAITAMRATLNDVITERDTLDSKLNIARETITKQEQELKIARDALARWEKRAEEMKLRERDAAVAIFTAEKHKAVADAYKDAMQIVFKPNAVRESILRNGMVPAQSSGYMASVTSTDTITKEDA